MPEPQDTADRWGQIEQLFHAALEQPLELRAAFLDQACGGDAGLRGEASVCEGDWAEGLLTGGVTGNLG
jgi:hypothetical protein